MPIIYLILVIMLCFYVNAAILFLLQPHHKMFPHNSSKISQTSVVSTICLATVVVLLLFFMSISYGMLGITLDMGLFGAKRIPLWYLLTVVLIGLSVFAPICSIASIMMKGVYDNLLLPYLRKRVRVSHAQLTNFGIKFSLILGFFLLVLSLHTLNESLNARVGRQYLKRMLRAPLPPSIQGIRYREIRRYADTSHWLKFISPDLVFFENTQHTLTVSDSCDWGPEPSPPGWWDVSGRQDWGGSAESPYLESYYVEGEGALLCYDTQHHVAYYHSIWRDY